MSLPSQQSASANVAIAAVLVCVLALASCQRGPRDGPKLPRDVLDGVKKLVESNGVPEAPVDIFSPRGGIQARSEEKDTLTVTAVNYVASQPPTTAQIGSFPPGTVMHYFDVEAIRRLVGGAYQTEIWRFNIVRSGTGEWSFRNTEIQVVGQQ